jgi:hypothetical protein
MYVQYMLSTFTVIHAGCSWVLGTDVSLIIECAHQPYDKDFC